MEFDLDMGLAAALAITAICYLLMKALRLTALNNKWIPAASGFLGCILGILGMFIIPDFPSNDLITSAAIGIVSGFAATGVHQSHKQLQKPKYKYN